MSITVGICEVPNDGLIPCYKYVKIMGWKSTKEISRKELEQKIEHEILYNIENLSNETLTYVLEILSDDEKSNISSGYNYSVKDE